MEECLKDLQTCFKKLPKEIRKHIFSSGPPTSPLAELVKSEKYQDLRELMLADWGELAVHYLEVVPGHFRDNGRTESMNIAAIYELMSYNIEARAGYRSEQLRIIEEGGPAVWDGSDSESCLRDSESGNSDVG